MTTFENSRPNSSGPVETIEAQLPVQANFQNRHFHSQTNIHDPSGFQSQYRLKDNNSHQVGSQSVPQIPPKPQNHCSAAQTPITSLQEVSNTPNRIVEENDAKTNTNSKIQIYQLSSSAWLLPRHPNSLFKIIPQKPKPQKRKYTKKIVPVIPLTVNIPEVDNSSIEVRASEVKVEDQAKLPPVEPKTKLIQKNPNFKPRKGKNQQPMAQKFIKKLSGFHYNKNYKQNRNKTLKKLAKRGLNINLENFSEYIGRLKLEINKKFKKPDMKVKTNTKGQEVNPKKSYDSYHSHFSYQKQREFIERFYNQVFKRVYVIMWKSDERMKRIDSIKIEGVNYENVETDLISEVKVQQKQGESEREPVTESRPDDKRASFIQCLDDEGKMELDRVFQEEYERLFEGFDWEQMGQEEVRPEKDDFKKKLINFCWKED